MLYARNASLSPLGPCGRCYTGIRPLPACVSAINSFSQPDTKGELQHFLGMINYYRRFLSGAASILKLITDDTRGAGSRQTSLCWDLGMQWALTSSKQH